MNEAEMAKGYAERADEDLALADAFTGGPTIRALAAERDLLREALKVAYNHLIFNGWKDDPGDAKRIKAVQQALTALDATKSALTRPSEESPE